MDAIVGKLDKGGNAGSLEVKLGKEGKGGNAGNLVIRVRKVM